MIGRPTHSLLANNAGDALTDDFRPETPNQERAPEWRGRPMGPWRSEKYLDRQQRIRHGLDDLDGEDAVKTGNFAIDYTVNTTTVGSAELRVGVLGRSVPS